ncbi:Scavenger receptor cysteine-rich domain-containing group B protein [Tupaia chinensis]|uniref:Scavenger receptor cysteine-rich domain-containing group B protein n=1 Tax=Tupaia chinensis TaxID=246437 RepID=L9K193_TUPCH|nr:Scavenger receptor cysteine-rich domain-containing group B protein [Tupaia chinensis]
MTNQSSMTPDSPTSEGPQPSAHFTERTDPKAPTASWQSGHPVGWANDLPGASSNLFTELRLVGGPSRCRAGRGRLEVLHGGSWGSVCDDDWDVVDANVVCRQLGCGLALPVPRPLAFGQGRGPILLDNVECRGQEATLSECGSRGWGIHNCFHYEDVAVLCDEFLPTQPAIRKALISRAPTTTLQNGKGEGSVRLVGGAGPCQGRVEILHGGLWGTVCDDDWGLPDATVVCRQLGCGAALAATTNDFFGYGTGHILLDNVHCEGDGENGSCSKPLQKYMGLTGSSGPPNSYSTATLSHKRGLGLAHRASSYRSWCPAFWGDRTVNHSRQGRGEEKRPGLVGGPGPCRGRVEVLYAGGWGTVCDDDWDFADARVACREAGCGPALGATGLGHFGYGRGPVLLDNVGCAGTEASLSDCFHLGWGQHNCGHHEDAGALCAGHLRLASGTHRCEGRVELFLGQRWGTVCDDAWDLRAAGVLCRQLGCGQALAAPGEAHFGPGRGPILLDNVKCRGDESTLLLCSHIRWDVHNCDHSEDASVLCQPS